MGRGEGGSGILAGVGGRRRRCYGSYGTGPMEGIAETALSKGDAGEQNASEGRESSGGDEDEDEKPFDDLYDAALKQLVGVESRICEKLKRRERGGVRRSVGGRRGVCDGQGERHGDCGGGHSGDGGQSGGGEQGAGHGFVNVGRDAILSRALQLATTSLRAVVSVRNRFVAPRAASK